MSVVDAGHEMKESDVIRLLTGLHDTPLQPQASITGFDWTLFPKGFLFSFLFCFCLMFCYVA